MDNNSSRTKNSILNLIFSLGGQVIDLILRFALRIVFIHTLGKDYLGLSGLFTNILDILSLADLGIGVAITFSLYKPLEENDERQLAILMRLFKKTYTIIGLVVLGVGAALTPFLDFFIKDMPDNIPHIQLIYLMFVVNSGISYFYSYKSSYIIANQKNYIVTNCRYLINVVRTIAQVVVLLIYQNYFAYLALQILGTLITNIIISAQADKMYPILKKETDEKLDSETKNTIIANVKALIIQRFGTIIVFSTDNVLLSKLFGLAVVGVYSNYTLVLNALEAILSQFFTAVTASIGNMGVNAEKEHQTEIFNVIYFVDFWMYSFSAVALGVLFQPFVSLCFGEDYVMETICVVFIVINFYLKGMNQSIVTFNNAYGLMRHYKYAPIPECLINIGASIVLGLWFGPVGIFIGTTMSTVLVPFWVMPSVLFKHGLDARVYGFWFRCVTYGIFTVAMFFVMHFILSLVTIGGIVGFVIKVILTGLIPNAVILLLFIRTHELQYLLGIAKRFISARSNINAFKYKK